MDNEQKFIKTDMCDVKDGVLTRVDCMRNIELPEGVIEIPPAFFIEVLDKRTYHARYRYGDMESIVFPKTVKKIGARAFEGLNNLKKVTLNEGLEEIGRQAFLSCGLEEIVIPKTVRKIGEYAFSGYHLKKVILSASIENIKEYAFDNHILEEITIKYKNYIELVNFITNSNFFNSINDRVPIESLKIIFEGPKLGLMENSHIKILLRKEKLNISFIEKDNTELLEKKEIKEKPRNKYDDDIQILVDKINSICTNLPDNIKNDILNKVNNLLDTYQKDIGGLKPTYDDLNDGLTTIDLNIGKDIKILKPKLLADLEMIIFNLSTAENIIKFLEELKEYKELLNTGVDSLSTEDTIKGNIQNIIYISKKIDEEKSKEVINRLSKYIDDTINNESIELNSLFESKPLSNNIDYKQEFMLNISNLYDEVRSEYKIIEPIKNLLGSLNVSGEEYSEGNELKDIIASTKYTITKIGNEEYRKEVEEKLNKLIRKYNTILNNILNDKELLKNTNIKEIERNIKEELQSILELLNKYANLSEYETNTANKPNLLNQLNESIKIVEDKKVKELIEDEELKPIISYAVELNNMIISNELIDEEDKDKMGEDLVKKLSLKKEELKEKNIDSIKEYYQFVKDVIYDLTGIELKINTYLSRMEEFNKFSK